MRALLALLSLFFFIMPVRAAHINVAYGYGVDNLTIARLGFYSKIVDKWMQSDTWRLDVLLDYGAAYLHTNKSECSTRLNVINLNPILRFKARNFTQHKLFPYLDLSIGLSYASNKNFGCRNLGSHWLFEDRLGLGVVWGQNQQFELGYRFQHYSNAYLSSPNHGINLGMLNFAIKF